MTLLNSCWSVAKRQIEAALTNNTVGGLTVESLTNASIAINGPDSTNRQLMFRTNGLNRWAIYVSGSETGLDAGGTFNIARYDDAGTFIRNALGINRSNGVVTISGDIFLGRSGQSSAAVLYVDGDPGFNRLISFRSSGIPRWNVGVTGVTESGSNAGSDFFITRSDDAGSIIGTAFSITRSTGAARFTGSVGFNNANPPTAPDWTAASGTASRATFATGSVTTSQLAERVKAIIDDLIAYGLFV